MNKNHPSSTDQFDNVSVAEIDATANEATLPGFDYTGFPTMFWVPKGSTTPEKYESGRDKNSMRAYIDERVGGGVEEDDTEEEVRDEL